MIADDSRLALVQLLSVRFGELVKMKQLIAWVAASNL
jgi:hypothetical protein